MKKELKVIAPAGRICPMEGGKHVGIITDKEAVTVPNTAFYRRRLAEGSLVPAKKTKPAETAAKKGEK